MTLILIVILILAVLWLVLGRPTRVSREALPARIPFFGARPSRDKFKLALTDALTARGSASGESAATLSNFTAWFNNLPTKEMDALVNEVDDDCKHANIQLDWLLDGRAKGESRQTLQDTVLLSALTYWRGRAAQPFVRLEDYLEKPNSRGNRKFGQDVFAKLVNSKRIVIPSEVLLASEKDRQKFAHDSISSLAQQDQDAVIAVVRETLEEEGKTAIPTAQAAPPPAETKTLPAGSTQPAS